MAPAQSAGASPSARRTYPPARRLRDSASFALFSASGRAAAEGRWWRGGRRWLAVAALIHPAQDGRMTSRYGVTVGKRNAARAIDRSLAKRVLREAARHAAPAIDAAAAAAGLQLDVVLRLKAPLPAPAALARTRLKRELRGEADALLQRLARELAEQVPTP